jgi:hypothetical protein
VLPGIKHGLAVRVEQPAGHVLDPHKVPGGRLTKQLLEQLHKVKPWLGSADNLALPLNLSSRADGVEEMTDKAARVGGCSLFFMSCALFNRWVLSILRILSLGDWFLARWSPGGEGIDR